MSSLVTLDTFRAQLRLSEDETSEDAYLQGLLDAAERVAELHLERSIAEDADLTDTDKLVIGQAVVVTASAWEAEREGGGGIPPAAIALLRPLRSWTR